MPSIAEKLRLHGAKTGFRFNGVWIVVQSGGIADGQKLFCQFGTDKDLIRLESDIGEDPREADFAHFLRPVPALLVGDILAENDRPENKWKVTSEREDHPYKPTVYFGVTKIVDGLDT